MHSVHDPMGIFERSERLNSERNDNGSRNEQAFVPTIPLFFSLVEQLLGKKESINTECGDTR
jgi:hypothetical protein